MSLDLTTFETRWGDRASPIARDLKLNFKKFSTDSSLSPVEVARIALAVGKAVDSPLFVDWARASLKALGADAEEILEVEESAALMGMLNSYYKFRSFISKASPEVVTEHYGQAGLRMTALARPKIGKEGFELLALVVSIVNGCETCIISHERVLRESNVAPAKIHDAVRLTAVIKGLSELDA